MSSTGVVETVNDGLRVSDRAGTPLTPPTAEFYQIPPGVPSRAAGGVRAQRVHDGGDHASAADP